MRIIASRKNRGLRKTTAVALLPCLMAQILIAGFYVPQTLRAGSEHFRKMTWEELPGFLNGEKKVTISLAEGGAVRGIYWRFSPRTSISIAFRWPRIGSTPLLIPTLSYPETPSRKSGWRECGVARG